MRFNNNYTRSIDHKIKIRFYSPIEAKRGFRILGKNETSPIYDLDYAITDEQRRLLDIHYISYNILDDE